MFKIINFRLFIGVKIFNPLSGLAKIVVRVGSISGNVFRGGPYSHFHVEKIQNTFLTDIQSIQRALHRYQLLKLALLDHKCSSEKIVLDSATKTAFCDLLLLVRLSLLQVLSIHFPDPADSGCVQIRPRCCFLTDHCRT